jgi:hypothetical protein
MLVPITIYQNSWRENKGFLIFEFQKYDILLLRGENAKPNKYGE